MMKLRFLVSVMLVAGLLSLDACKDSTTVINGNWLGAPDYGGSTASGAFCFTIGDRAYVGLGHGGLNGLQYLKDCYSFSATDNFWKAIAPFPGTGRELAVAFSLGGKGYVGTGLNQAVSTDSTNMDDFWEYTPETDTWRQVASYPHKLFGATTFTTNEGAFVGTGYNGNYYNDFYQYIPGAPGADKWERIPDLNHKRRGAMTLVLNGKVFLFGGESSANITNEFYEYDPATKVWTSRAQLSTNANYTDFSNAVRRSFANAFTLNDKGYVVCGGIGGTPTQLVYQYDPLTDVWTRMTPYQGTGRTQAVSFVIGGRAFVGTGTAGSSKLYDFYEWRPNDESIDGD